METERIKLSTLLAATAAVIFIEVITRLVSAASPDLAMAATGVARLADVSALLFLARRMQFSLSPVGLTRSKFGAGLIRGIAWSFAFAALTALGFAGCYLAGINPFDLLKAPLPQKPVDVLIFFLVGAGLAPIAEEIYFRGVLYGYLRRWGPVAAIIGSSLLFVAAHPNLNQLPIPQLVGGLVFATAYEVEKNLVVPIVIHAAGNFALFSLSLIH